MIPANFVKAQIIATLQGGEQMVHGVYIKNVTVIDATSLQVLATGVRDQWYLFLTSPTAAGAMARSFLSTNTAYQKVVVYSLAQGTGLATDSAEDSFGPESVGSAGSTAPTELAVCATLLTGAPGRSKRGRMYLGGFGTAVIDNNGRVNNVAQAALATSLARFYRGIRDIGAGTAQQDAWEPQVVSATTGTARKITQVSVGNVFDVQRRRRNKLIEQRVSADVG